MITSASLQLSFRSLSQLSSGLILTSPSLPHCFDRDNRRPAGFHLMRHGFKIIQVLDYKPDSHRLRFSASSYGPTYPGQIAFTLETLGFRRTGISPVFSLLMPAFSLPSPPEPLTGIPSSVNGMLPYHLILLYEIRNFGIMLSPVTLSAPGCSTSELLRTLLRNGCF